MGHPHKTYIDSEDVFGCIDCGNQLTTASQLLSTNFRGRTGTAWLFSKVVNVTEGPFEERMMTTGQHTIVDIYCNECGANLGWKYEDALEESQKYKRGKFILEKALLTGKELERINSSSESHDEEHDPDPPSTQLAPTQ